MNDRASTTKNEKESAGSEWGHLQSDLTQK
jgi:hypothetical protein